MDPDVLLFTTDNDGILDFTLNAAVLSTTEFYFVWQVDNTYPFPDVVGPATVIGTLDLASAQANVQKHHLVTKLLKKIA